MVVITVNHIHTLTVLSVLAYKVQLYNSSSLYTSSLVKPVWPMNKESSSVRQLLNYCNTCVASHVYNATTAGNAYLMNIN